MMIVDLLTEPFNWMSFAAAFQGSGATSGGQCQFVGFARGTSKQGEPLGALFLEHHPRMTLSSLRVIAERAEREFALDDVCAIHRAGRILPGEAIVFVAARAPHRRNAIDAVDFMMDKLKSEALFWKREEGDGFRRWVEPTEQDIAAAAKWETQ